MGFPARRRFIFFWHCLRAPPHRGWQQGIQTPRGAGTNPAGSGLIDPPASGLGSGLGFGSLQGIGTVRFFGLFWTHKTDDPSFCHADVRDD